MARQDPDLIQPVIYTILVGLGVTALGLIPVCLSLIWLAQRPYGLTLTTFLVVGVFFAQLAVGAFFGAMSHYLGFGYLAEGDGRLPAAWQYARRTWLDWIGLPPAQAMIGLVRGLGWRGFFGRQAEAAWLQAPELIGPVMVAEGTNLSSSLTRTGELASQQTVLAAARAVGARPLARLLAMALGLIGLLVGTGAGLILLRSGNAALVPTVLALGLGLLMASLFILIGIAIFAFISAQYSMCVYLWAREAEYARLNGLDLPPAPAPLQSALLPAQPATNTTPVH